MNKMFKPNADSITVWLLAEDFCVNSVLLDKATLCVSVVKIIIKSCYMLLREKPRAKRSAIWKIETNLLIEMQ